MPLLPHCPPPPLFLTRANHYLFENICIIPRRTLVSISTPQTSLPLGHHNHSSTFCLHINLFWILYIKSLYSVWPVSGLFPLACFQGPSMLQHVSKLYYILWLNNIPFYWYTTVATLLFLIRKKLTQYMAGSLERFHWSPDSRASSRWDTRRDGRSWACSDCIGSPCRVRLSIH